MKTNLSGRAIFAGICGAVVLRILVWGRTRDAGRGTDPDIASQPPGSAAREPLGGAVEVMDAAVLRRRAIDIFPGAYVTLLSIIQATALGLLAVGADSHLRHATSAVHRGAIAIQAAAVMAAIFTVYYMYVWFCVVVRWAPTVYDSLLPFGLGIGEIAMIQSIGDHGTFLLRIAVMEAAGALAFAHSVWRCRREAFANVTTYKSIRRLLQAFTVMMGLGALTAGAAYTISTLSSDATVRNLSQVFSFVAIAFAIVMIGMSERTLASVFGSHGIAYYRKTGSRHAS